MRQIRDGRQDTLITEFVAEGGHPAEWLERWHEQFNIKPTEPVRILLESAKGTAQSAELTHWSLVPSFSKTLALKFPTFNARSEGAAEKPTWRASVKSKRCVIRLTDYYEWRADPEATKLKTPYFISAPDQELILFAGLYS